MAKLEAAAKAKTQATLARDAKAQAKAMPKIEAAAASKAKAGRRRPRRARRRLSKKSGRPRHDQGPGYRPFLYRHGPYQHNPHHGRGGRANEYACNGRMRQPVR